MRICIVAYKFGTEKEIGEHLGTYHYFIEITRKLVKAGHQVYVVTPWISFFKKGSAEIDGVKIIRYYPPVLNKIWLWPINRLVRFWYLKATQKKVLKTVNRHNLETVFVWQARETGYAISKIKDKLKVPFIFRQITTWQWHFDRSIENIFGKKSWYSIIKKLKLNFLLEFLLDRKSQKKFAEDIYQQADKVAFTSQIAADEGIEMGLNQSKVEILPVCIEADLFKPLNRKNELRHELGINGRKVILFIGRINFAEKGIGYLLESFQKIRLIVPEATLAIIGGGGETDRMKELIKKLKIEDNVQLLGQKPFTDLVKYINTADVFVVPSVWLETFGQVTIEAMACAVPVVTFDSGASPYINLDGQTGFVVPNKNSEKLAQAIVKLLNNQDLQKSFGQAARQRVLDNYTYEVVVKKMIEIIQRAKNG